MGARLLVPLLVLCGSARGADGPLALRISPERLVLGDAARATIEVDAPFGPPSITTNVGRIEGVRAAGAGRYTAEYLPPEEAYPQVAVVSAVSGGRAAWVAVPLVGRGLATARSRPGAPIRVSIGEAVFGPVRADLRGDARVPVVVPPGVAFAYHREKPLDLGIPSTLHVHLALGRGEAPADAAQEVAIWAFAVTPAGAPRPGAPVSVEVSHGRVDDLAEVAPGAFAAIWRLPAGRAEPASATARLEDEPGPVHALRVVRPAGLPARLAVTAGRTRLAPGVAEAIRIDVSDAAGNPVDAAPRLETSFGSVSPPTPLAAGAWEAVLQVPRELGRVRRAEIVARAAGLESRLALPVASGAAARLVVAVEPETLVADGDAEARVRVEVRDAFGNGLEVDAPEVATTRRATISTAREPDGAWVVRYHAARARRAGEDVLAVRAGGLEGVARLRLTAPEPLLAIAPKLGLAASTAALRSAYLALEGALQTRARDGRLGLVLELATFVHDRTDVVAAGAGTLAVHGHARYVTLLASARWREPLGTRWVLLADGGAGLARVAGEVSAGAAPPSAGSAVTGALRAAAGLGLRVGPGAAFVETGVARIGDPALETLRGAAIVFTVSGGYRYDAY